MDLSQFDEASTASRSLPPAPHSPSQPDIIVTAGGQEELEQSMPFVEGTESTEVTPAAETIHRCYKLMYRMSCLIYNL